MLRRMSLFARKPLERIVGPLAAEPLLAIVNLDRIAALQPWDRDEHVLVLKNGVRIDVGRSYKQALERRLGASRR